MRKFALFVLTLGVTTTLAADPIPVRRSQGLTHGFVNVRSEEGKLLAHGEITQTTQGDRVSSRLTYRFLDGSLDDETTTFLQRGNFRLLRDHHIQRGPFFSKPTDIAIDAATGDITTRSTGDDGKQKVEVEHKDLPLDLVNGMVPTVLVNLSRDTQELKLGIVFPSGKGRLGKIAISPAGTGVFTVAGAHHTASIFRIKVDLGGIAGVVAPVIGKQPADTMVWLVEGEAPGVVRLVGQLAEGGPMVSVELAGASFSR